jgi:hypothetical protein
MLILTLRTDKPESETHMRHPQAGFSSRRAKSAIFARAALPGMRYSEC